MIWTSSHNAASERLHPTFFHETILSETQLPQSTDSPESARNRMIVLGLILMTLACYWPIGKADFINYDDNRYITDNANAQQGLTRNAVKFAFTSTDGGYRHPLTWFTHLLDVELYGPKRNGTPLIGRLIGSDDPMPAGHHFTNLIIHLADTILLWYVLKRLTQSVWASAWVAAVFAVHPMHVESVAWVSERKDVLSTFFFLLTILAYQRYTERLSLKRYGVVALAFAAALMSKPMMMTTPGVLLLLDFWPLNRITLDSCFFWSIKRSLLEKLPLLALSAASGAISVLDTRSVKSFYTLKDIPLSMRLETSITSYARYLGKLFWPTNLVIFYPTPLKWSALWVIGSIVIFLTITALVVWRMRKQPYLLFGWLWFVGTLVPVIGLVVTGDASIAERYTYVSYVGVFIAIAWLACDLIGRHRGVLIGLGVVSLAACSVLAYRQVWNWRDSRTLMYHGMQVSPNNWAVYNNYACALLSTKDELQAGPYFETALRFRPGSGLLNVNYARYLLGLNRIDEADPYLQVAYKIDPENAHCLTQVARLQALKGRHLNAIKIYEHVLKSKPNEIDTEMLLASSLNALLRRDEAEAHYRRILDIDPRTPMAHYQLAKLAADRNDAAAAVTHFRRAIELNPDYGMAHLDYGITLAALSRFDEAIEQLTLATKNLLENQTIQQSTAELTIGKILQKTAQPTDTNQQLEAAKHFIASIELAEKAVAETPDEPMVHYELSMRLKQVGRTEDGLIAARKAIEVAAAHGNLYFLTRLAEEFPSLAPTTQSAIRPTTGPSTPTTTAPVQ